MKDHRSTHKFVPIGGCKSGNRKFADSPYGYYSYVFINYNIYPATATDKKYRYRYGLSLVAPFVHYAKIELHLQHARTYSYTIGTKEILYVQLGHIILGKLGITLWYKRDKLEIAFSYARRMDYRAYKVANNIKHDYHHYKNAHSEYDYEYLKDNRRQIHKWRRSK